MVVRRKRARPGDILEVATPGGRAYLHYLGKHPEYGDAVVVSPRQYRNAVSDMSRLFEGGHIAFYPAMTAAAQGLVQVVGHLPSPGVPTRVRRPGARLGTHVQTWIIEDGHGEEVKRYLSEEERKLPIAVIWNHEMLTRRVTEGWRPEREGDDHE